MDYLYESHANERIRSGNLPNCPLKKDSIVPAIEYDFHEKCHEALAVMSEIFPYIGTALHMFINMLPELEAIRKPLNFVHDVNLLINTEFNPRSINIDGPAAKRAIQLCPCVTTIDKALRMVIELYGQGITLISEDSKEETVAIFFTWLYLLKNVQENERVSGKTLNLSVINDDTLLFELLSSPWTETYSHLLIDLSAEDKQAIDDLYATREDIKNSICEENSTASSVALETESSWDLFLEILNDLSEREHLAVNQVCSNIAAGEKLDCIRQYLSLFHCIQDGNYAINGITHDLSSLIRTIKKRIEQAPAYCNVKDDNAYSFRLCPETADLLSKPLTFNLLLLSYHQFRLEHSKDNAMHFSNLALSGLYRNFLVQDEVNFESIEAIVEEFGKTFLKLARNNQSSIRELSFDSIQLDTVATGLTAVTAFAFDRYNNHLHGKIASAEQAMQEKGIDAYYKEFQAIQYTKDQIESAIEENNQAIDQSVTATVARQVVVSLNIAYLLCDALRIMQSFNHEHRFFIDENLIDHYVSDLEWEIDQVSCSVYTREANLKKFRKDKGIDANMLSIREAAETKIRNDAFSRDILDSLTALANAIDTIDLNGLIDLNVKVRSKIRKYTVCNLEEDYYDQFVDICNRICNRLIVLCRSTVPSFDSVKTRIVSQLGVEASRLPSSAVESLTTAEYLYERYASEDYANKGFDYSCISSLYYQAFEDAYNTLIWRNYADFLNGLSIDGRSFTDILYANKQTDDLGIRAAKGYLANTAKSRRYYVDYDYDAGTASVKSSLMYTSFASILGRIRRGSNLQKFSGYFARKAGFPNSYAMFEDSHYMDALHAFAVSIEETANDRNNASHGGSPVSITQCEQDKLTVLYKLESVRADSIGLIQKLLYLMKNGT